MPTMNKTMLNLKLQEVFKKISEPGYNPTSNFCFEKLLSYISTDLSSGNEDVNINLPSVLQFVIVSSSHWNNDLKDMNNFVKTFILRLTAKVTTNESLFLNCLNGGVYDNTFTFFDLQSQKNPSIKQGLLEILTAMTCHDSGIQWLIEKRKWFEVIKLCQLNHTIYLFRGGSQFLSTFIWKLNDMNNKCVCEEVLIEIVTPVLDNQWKDCTIIDSDENSQMHAALIPSLNILTDLLYNIERFGKTNLVTKILSELNFKWRLCNLFNLCRKSDLLVGVTKVLYLYLISNVSIDKVEYEMTEHNLLEYALIQCNTVTTLLTKRNADAILDVCSFAFILISKIRDYHKISMEIEKEGKTLELTNQIVIISLMPMLCSLKLYKNEFVDAYVDKLVSVVCEHTTRLLYSFRDLIREKNDPMVVVKAIRNTITYMKYLNKSQGVLIFQSFYYCLQDFVPQGSESDTNYVVIGVDSRETISLMSTMLDAIYIYIDHFGIQWQETVEILCVHNFCARILKTSNIDPKLNMLAFKLAQLTIKKFLSPNLALLMNSAEGSIIEEIGKNIYVKLHDTNWGIRDSAMELLYIVTDVAEFKFPPFQQQITENELPELTMTLALEDSESYVRSSALRCISTMVRIKIIWENHLKYFDLPAKMMKLLYEESEGQVRIEAARVIINMYEGKKFAASILDDVFVTMFHSAVKDLHWEVQLLALEFWRKVIMSQMSHQGMIDGVFPSVTFSKENRKIVQLNEFEIQKRLKKILNELALRGCLGALLCCMDDESEIEVMEKALEIIDEVIQLFDKYNLTEISSLPDTSLSKPRPVFDVNFTKNEVDIAKISKLRNKADVRNELTGGEMCITLNNTSVNECSKISDNIIESIVNADDVNLLANVYNNQLKVIQAEKNNKYDFAKTNGVKDVSNMFVEPEVFLKTVRETDYRNIIDLKLKWRSGISSDIYSLIEDILATYNTSDINSMDCY